MRIRWGLLVIPMVIFNFVFFIAPQFAFIRNSFFESGGAAIIGERFVLANYVGILADSYYLNAFLQTVKMSAAVVLGALFLGYPLAYVIARSKSRWGFSLMLILFISSFIGVVVRTLGWKVILGDHGPVNQMLLSLHLFSSPLKLVNNLTGAIIGLIHVQLPFMTLILVPVIQAVDPALEEAAAGLGARGVTIFRKVLLPLTLPGIIAGSILTFAISMGVFTTPAILGGGRIAIISILIQQQIMTVLNYPMGAALAFILSVLVMMIVLAVLFSTKRRGYGSWGAGV